MSIRPFIRRVVRHTRGATAIEYGLICALVVLAMIGSLKLFAGGAVDMWNNVSDTVQNNT